MPILTPEMIAQPEFKLGDVADRYRLKREIAQGGMSIVYEAEHLVTGGRVALKLLLKYRRSDTKAQRRLIQEAKLLARLRHPNIVTLYDAGECAEFGPFIALELIEGRSLDGILISRGKLPVDQSLAVIIAACHALEEAHHLSIIHRDIKPANLFIAKRPGGRSELKLLDFGVAGEHQGSKERLTEMGDVVGTPEYMAPEQLMNTTAYDYRADIYSLGVLLYECLSGHLPYQGTLTSFVSQFMTGAPPRPLDEPELSEELKAVISRALALDPNERFQTTAGLKQACLALLEAPPKLDILSHHIEARRPAETLDERKTETFKKRAFVRAPYIAPVRLILPDGTYRDGRTADISEGGTLILLENPCPVDLDITIKFALPSGGRVITAPGKTKWVKENLDQGGRSRSRHAIGVQFREASTEALQDIRYYTQWLGEPKASTS